jgi:hypothetical protein
VPAVSCRLPRNSRPVAGCCCGYQRLQNKQEHRQQQEQRINKPVQDKKPQVSKALGAGCCCGCQRLQDREQQDQQASAG